MGIGPLISLAGGYIESLFTKSLSGPASTNTTSTGNTNASGSSQDPNRLSPFAQVLSSLQQLQQSNPSQYQQVTQQISGNLQTAAQSATASGNNSLANELTQLSNDFNSASTNGQLPNFQDLARAIGGGYGHYHLHHAEGLPPGNTPLSVAAAGSPTSALSSLLRNQSQPGLIANNSLSPLSIIDNTLSGAGIQGA